MTESIRKWLRTPGGDVLVLNVPGAEASIVAKTLDDSVLHDVDTVALKVKLNQGGSAQPEAHTVIKLKRT